MKYLCVYCGAADGASPAFTAAARSLGSLIGARGHGLVYGAARVGLMGTVADSALACGAPVLGVIPQQLRPYEVEHPNLTELHWTDGMHPRKRRMADLSHGFVALPGGYGTLDEILETINLRQLGEHRKPIVLVDIEGFFAPLLELFAALTRQRFAHAQQAELFTVVPSPEAAIAALEHHWRESA